MRKELNNIEMDGEVVIKRGNGRSTNALYREKATPKMVKVLIRIRPTRRNKFCGYLPNFSMIAREKVIYFQH